MITSHRTRTLLAGSVLISMALGGCAAASPQDTESTGEPQSQAGGSLTYAITAVPCLDAHYGGNHQVQSLARNYVDSLLDYDPDSHEFIPWLASSYEVNSDSTLFTFTIREDVTFSDGTELTAEVVKLNLDTLVRLGQEGHSDRGYQALSNYVSTTVVDEDSIEVAFSRPSATFLLGLTLPATGILGESTLAKTYEERCSATEVVATGPFVISDYEPQVKVALSKRDGYAWASPLSENQGEAHLDELTFQLIPEVSVATGSLRSGQIEGLQGGVSDTAQQLAGGGFWNTSVQAAGIQHVLNVNPNAGVLGDRAVRQAINRALDREEISAVPGDEFAPPATSVISEANPGWTDLSELLAYDADEAAKLLEGAGWLLNNDTGYRERGGERLSIRLGHQKGLFAVRDATIAVIQDQLERVGFAVTIEELDAAAASEVLKTRDFDLFYFSTTAADADVLRRAYSTSGSNRLGLAEDDPLVAVLDQQAVSSDVNERDELLAEAQRTLIEEGYVLPVLQIVNADFFASTVHDVFFQTEQRISFQAAWLEH